MARGLERLLLQPSSIPRVPVATLTVVSAMGRERTRHAVRRAPGRRTRGHPREGRRLGNRTVGVSRKKTSTTHCAATVRIRAPLSARARCWPISLGPRTAAGSVSTRGPGSRCPCHGWEYDIRTGKPCFGASDPSARGYHVSDTTATLASQVPGRAPGPYVTDSYGVRVQHRYIVVDTSCRPDGLTR